MRTRRDDIRALGTASSIIELCDGQWFCELPKSYELWGVPYGRPIRLKRWDRKRILWVFLRQEPCS